MSRGAARSTRAQEARSKPGVREIRPAERSEEGRRETLRATGRASSGRLH